MIHEQNEHQIIESRLNKLETSLEKIREAVEELSASEKVINFIINELKTNNQWKVEKEMFEKRISDLEDSVDSIYRDIRSLEVTLIKNLQSVKDEMKKDLEKFSSEVSEKTYKLITLSITIATTIMLFGRFLLDYLIK